MPAWLIWFLIGIGLAFLEVQLPGFIVLFFGVGCWAVAGALLLWPLTVTQQVLLFMAATVVSIVLLRKWLMRIFRGMSSEQADKDFDDFPSGARVKVAQRITPRENGRILFRGTLWDAAADEEIEEGEVVEIIRYAEDSRQIYFVKKAMEAQMTAEREKRAAIAKSEGDRQSTINRAEGERQDAILRSEGEKQERINEAEGKAQEILAVAQATAQGLRTIAEQLEMKRRPGGRQSSRGRAVRRRIRQTGPGLQHPGHSQQRRRPCRHGDNGHERPAKGRQTACGVGRCRPAAADFQLPGHELAKTRSLPVAAPYRWTAAIAQPLDIFLREGPVSHLRAGSSGR